MARLFFNIWPCTILKWFTVANIFHKIGSKFCSILNNPPPPIPSKSRHPCQHANLQTGGREPWSSGYGKRLTFQRMWVQILALHTAWTFFTYICCKNCNDVCLKRPKINKKEAGVGPFFNLQTGDLP